MFFWTRGRTENNHRQQNIKNMVYKLYPAIKYSGAISITFFLNVKKFQGESVNHRVARVKNRIRRHSPFISLGLIRYFA